MPLRGLVFPFRAVSALVSVLTAPGCAPPPVEIPRLADAREVDPALAQRVDELVQACASNPDRLVELGMVYEANGVDELALKAYETALPHSPGAELWYHVGRLRDVLGTPEGALAAFEESRTLDPRYAPTHWRRGALLLDLGRLEEAGDAFRGAVRLAPEEAPGWLGLARIHLQQGEPEEAIAVLEPLVERNHREPFANGLLARAYVQVGDDERAQLALRREKRSGTATVRDPWTAMVMRNAVGLYVGLERARGALAGGDFRAALAIAEPLYREHADELALTHLYAQILIRAGNAARALEILSAFPGPEADHYLLELSRGQALAALAPPRTEEARSHLENAVRANPSYAEAHVSLGELRLELDQPRAAGESFRTAIDLGDRSVRLWTLLARTLRGAERIAVLDQALEEYPNSVDLWAYWGIAQAGLGRTKEAREAMQRIEERRPDHEQLGRLREAIRSAESSERSKTDG